MRGTQRSLGFALGVLVALLVPAAAQAAMVRVDDGPFPRVRYEAGPDESNRLTVSGDDQALTFVDEGAAIAAGAGCAGGGDPGVPVVCMFEADAQLDALDVRLGALRDSLDTTAVAVSSPFFDIPVDAGTGRDTVTGGAEAEHVLPGRGADRVRTGAGNDSWEQRAKRPDRRDVFDGGAGEDSADYATPYRLRVRLDRIANDGGRGGRRGERDKLVRVENVSGARKADVLVGNDADNRISDGNTGGDVLRGLAGDDSLTAARGADRVLGGRGGDTIVGGTGRDVLHGGRGDDFINAKRHFLGEPSGRDRVDCGRGDDTAIVHRGDRVRDCETVRRR